MAGLRRARWPVGLAAVLVALVGIALAALPEIVRSVAVREIAALTRRELALDDVDLNLFTGRVALKGFRLAQRDSSDTALGFERLDAGVSLASLLFKHARVTELRLTAPRIAATRTGPTTFDFSDLLALIPPPDPHAPPLAWLVTIDRVAIERGTIVARDRVTAPPSEWRVDQLTVDGGELTTRRDGRSGRVAVRAQINGARFAVDAGGIALASGTLTATVTLDGFSLGAVAPYVPAEVAAVPRGGSARLALKLAAARRDGRLQLQVGGDVTVEQLAVIRRDADRPLLTLARLDLGIARADLVTREVVVGRVALDGLALEASRGRDGVIDLLTLVPATPPAPGGTNPAVTTPAAAPAFTLEVDEVTLRRGRFTFTDHAVSPTAVLPVTDLTLSVRDVTWPNTRPSPVETTMTIPGGGRFALKGSARATPFEAVVETSLRDGNPEPFAAYMPVRARVEGRFHGDNRAEVRMTAAGITARARGRGWADKIVVRDPDVPAGQAPPVRVERMALDGIDFAWPTSARVAKVTIVRPDARIARTSAGAIDVLGLLEAGGTDRAGGPDMAPRPTVGTGGPDMAPRPPYARTPPAKPGSSSTTGIAPGPATHGAPGATLALDFDAIVIEDGSARFVDHTTDPAFTESLSRVAVTLTGLSNTPGRRGTLAMRAVLGPAATLETRGEIAPFGELYADVVTELRDYPLPAVSPYVNQAIAWIIEQGSLSATVRARVERGALDARNDIDVRRLAMARGPGHDTAQQRLGLPLGLIVALVTDRDNGLKVAIPITGRLDDPQFAWGDAAWAAVKNVVVNVAAAPFRAIGRLFTGSDNRIDKLEVAPVTFTAGSAALAPDTEPHLVRVADFLRGAPRISLALAPVVTRGDADGLRAAALRDRVEKRQREESLPDWAAAVAAEYRRRFPGTPAPATEEQLARLTEAEPLPEEAVSELRARRIRAVVDALTRSDGVTVARLRTRQAPPVGDETGPGRVQFEIAATD